MNIRLASLALALMLGACSRNPPLRIVAVPEARSCPAYPLPPPALVQPPARIDFLTPTGSSPLNRPSSSTN